MGDAIKRSLFFVIQLFNASCKKVIHYFLVVIYSFFIIHCGAATASSPVSTPATSNAVILMYHNVATNTPPSTSVTPERFKQHIEYLSENGFTIWPLFKTLVHLATGKAIPPKTVVLTFDDAYKSVYTEAFPVLKTKGWPFTVFVSTQYIAEGYRHYMSWQQLREIQRFGGEVGNHSLTHPHMIRHRNGETKTQWRERIINEIEQSQLILQQNVDHPLRAVAYPYGEYSEDVRDILRELGYFGLGQHSGAVSPVTDFQAIPRFPMSTGFDSMEDFAIKVSAKNLPVTVLSPDDGLIAKDTDIPVLVMQLETADYKKTGLRCYASGQGCIHVEWQDRENGVVRVSANDAIKPGRTKYNCTAPSKSEDAIFYWFSFLWMKPEADGSWYRE